MVTAADLMAHPAIAIDREAPLAQAIHLMADHRISGLPVVDSARQLVGMLTEGDLLRRIEIGTEGARPNWLMTFLAPARQAKTYVLTHGRRVSEVMTASPVSVAEDTPASQIVDLMREHGVKRLPVLRGGRLVGIVSRADLVRRVGEILSTAPEAADDQAIRAALNAAMERQAWSPGRLIAVGVQDGVVQLDGCIFDTREREAMQVLAENLPGVKRVENRIICVEPYLGTVIYDPAA
jgi:CBS domain-containing protein